MNEFTSRAENIRRREMEAAKRGQWSLKTKLYKSEIKKFSKQDGVTITAVAASHNGKLFEAEISWQDALKFGVLLDTQVAYIKHETNEVPSCGTYAERLAIETWRAIDETWEQPPTYWIVGGGFYFIYWQN